MAFCHNVCGFGRRTPIQHNQIRRCKTTDASTHSAEVCALPSLVLLPGPDKQSDVLSKASHTPARGLIDYRVTLGADKSPDSSVKNVDTENVDIVVDSVLLDVAPVDSR